MKHLLAFLALCLPLYLFAQGFGSFSHDQPFFAKDVTESAPIPLVDLFAWLKPEDITGTTGDPVTMWPDSSGNNHYATNRSVYPVVTMTPPVVTNNCIAGYSAVRWPNSSILDGLFLYNTRAFTRNMSGNTFFILMRFGTLADVIFDNDQGGGGGISRLKFSHYSGSTGAIRGSRTDGGFDNSDPFNMTTGWALYSVRVTWSTATAMVRINGSLALLDTSFSTAGNTSDTDQNTNLALGCDFNGNNSIINSEIAEFIAYKGALSDAEIEAIETYIETKYSLNWP